MRPISPTFRACSAGGAESVRSDLETRRPIEIRRTAEGHSREGSFSMEQTPHTTLTKDPRSGEALSVRRLFTQAGVHPFDTVEWETRTAAVGTFRQDGVEF